jgi:transposase
MGAPYTLDLGERVVAACRSGMSRIETATVFKVSESSVQRWSRLDREKGSVAAKPMGGNRPFALVNERDRLLERIAQQPDLPLRALLAELGSRGIKVSNFALWNIVDRANVFRLVPRPGQAIAGLHLTVFERRANLLSRFETITVGNDGLVILSEQAPVEGSFAAVARAAVATPINIAAPPPANGVIPAPARRSASVSPRSSDGSIAVGMNSMIRSACCAASGAAMPVTRHR